MYALRATQLQQPPCSIPCAGLRPSRPRVGAAVLEPRAAHPLMAAADHGFVVRSRTAMSRPITYLVMEDEFPLGCCTTRAPANSTGMSGALIGIM